MTTFTVFFKAQVNGSRFCSSTVLRASSKKEAAALVLRDYSYAYEITSVMLGR